MDMFIEEGGMKDTMWDTESQVFNYDAEVQLPSKSEFIWKHIIINSMH